MKAVWFFFLACVVALAAHAQQPTAPELVLIINEPPAPPTGGRFEFAPIPEHVFVRGRPEKVQMGIWQLDPANRWTPGDQTRASGWTSSRITRLVDVSTGQPTPMLQYDPVTAEINYTGSWSGDVIVRLETADGAVKSNDFRIRVLTPTVVYGYDAGVINTAHQWNAVTCEYPEVKFADCRTRFKGGASDIAPLVIYFPTGSYGGQDWYLTQRQFIYVIGEPGNWPTLSGGTMSPGTLTALTYRNLKLNNTNLAAGGRPKLGITINLSNIDQCCEGPNVQNGFVNANGTTKEPWLVTVWNYVTVGMGNQGNTNHAFYVEGRAKGRFEINNSQCRGAKGSSCFKSDMRYYSIRNTLICTTQSCTSEGAGTPAAGMTTHSMVDTPAAGTIIVYNNHFKYWKNHTANLPNGYPGAYTPPVFIRQRQAFRGSDIPLYPNVTYDPPVASASIRGDPGGGWDGSAATMVDPKFWADVATGNEAFRIYDHYISFNVVERMPGTVGSDLPVLRDDGTPAIEAVTQFGPGRALRVPQNWTERSRNFLYGNSYLGIDGDPPPNQLHTAQQVVEIEPGAVWPRSKPEHFPTAVDVTGELPPWFKL